MFKSIGSTWILNGLQMAVLLVLSPFVLRHLGPAQNGVWVTIVSFTGVLSLLILGVPMASVRSIAAAAAKKDLAAENRAIATCLGICAMLGVVALFAAVGLYFLFDQRCLGGAQGVGLAPQTLEQARLAFLVVGAQVACGFALRLPYGIFDAHGEFVLRNSIMAGELFLRFGTTVALLSWHAELPMLALVQVLSMLAEFGAALYLIRKRHPGLHFSLARFERGMLREILGFSVFALLLNVGTLLAFRLDAMVIGLYLPAQSATDFDVGNKFFDPLTQLLISVGAVIMPLATRLQATGELDELRHVFLKWSKISLSIVLVVGLYLIVLGPDFLSWWMGPEYAGPSGSVLCVLMASFLFYLPVRGVALPVLMGLGKPKAPAIALLVMGSVNLALSLALVKPLGIRGVALGTAVPNVLFALYVLARACRELGLGLGAYASYVVMRALLGALVPLAFLLACKYLLHVEGFLPLFGAGLAMVLLFGVVWILFVYRRDPYFDLAGRLARRWRGPARKNAA